MDIFLPPRAFPVIENSSPAPLPPAKAEREETWKHISVALAPVVSRIRRLREMDKEAGQ